MDSTVVDGVRAVGDDETAVSISGFSSVLVLGRTCALALS